MMDRQFELIDILKFIFCLCIVAIHTNAFSGIAGGYYYLETCILRIAVPFFFVSSGFFYGRNLKKRKSMKDTLQAYSKRLIFPLFFWEFFNIIIEIVKQYFIKNIPFRIIVINVVKSVLFYPYGALWYVQALFVAILIVSGFYRLDRLNLCLGISILLYLVGLLGNTYYFVVIDTPVRKFIDLYLSIFVSTRNGIFVGLFFVTMGMWISVNYKKIISIKYKWAFILFGYGALVIETIITRNYISADDNSMFVAFIIVIPAIFLVVSLNRQSFSNSRIYRNYSVGIYFIHKIVIHIWKVINLILDINIFPFIEFVIAVLSCVIFLWIIYKVNNKYLNILVK